MSAAKRLQGVESHVNQGELVSQLRTCKKELEAFVDAESCHPIMIRLAWHDSGTYDDAVKEWPHGGGANGSIRFKQELEHGANAGLFKAITFLKPFKAKFPLVSWADLIQMASAVSVEAAGGPKIEMRYGREETQLESECPKEGNLPAAAGPFDDGSRNAAEHTRRVFYRMGFNDQEIVALMGAHTLGRGFKGRSGTVEEGYGAKNGTEFTDGSKCVRSDGKKGVGMPGGRSWTERWLTFDNSYYHYEQREKETNKKLLWLETDRSMHTDPEFRKFFQLYAKDEGAWRADYAAAHLKLSELGSKFTAPIVI